MNENNGIPLYYQLKEIIKEKINNGVWGVDDRIPNEIDLAKQYNLSRSTVRQAILTLVREGALYRKQGRGTFVAKPKLDADFINFYFPQDLGTQHKLIRNKEMECLPSINELLEIQSDQKVYELFRIRLFNEEPAALEKSYITSDLVPNFENNNFEGRLYDLLSDEYGIDIVKAENYIEPIILEEYEASKLEVQPMTPALKLTRLGKDMTNQPVVFTESIIRGDRCRIYLKSR
ncbi:GntR family transcriptional regulator [Alteribacillus sp. YIM 98480]|uniref:GntR family transcriptional regulator n=1 Tax=Alteribacillus sp. YIM 98480 TaxID=2606599 RepID=UPI00131D8F66|nr:GntR family transcriptional regulator [Alteribacillus sp. YIM 98480]